VSALAATRFGKPLPEGGTIGVCAPSGPYFNRSDVLRPKEWWESRGYVVKLSEGIWEQDDYVAGDAKGRASDLNALFADPEVDVIQVLWGGTGAMQTLPLLDYEAIAANPKALMGFSDITNLHVALLKECGLATFHGPGLGSMGLVTRTEFTMDSARNAFATGAAGPVPRDPDDPYLRTLAPGKVTAPIVGGNLFTLTHLIGTPWQPSFEGAIFFFEEVEAYAYEIDYYLQHMKMAGLLEGVAGVVVGELYKCDATDDHPDGPRTRSIEDVLEAQLGPLGVPVLYKLPLGHGKHIASIPLGVAATLDADARTLEIDQAGVLSAS
jgi:muramoyltetrapeptide carboxypeptidase